MEENNEIMVNSEVNDEPVVDVEVEESGMSTGVAILIGSALTLAIGAGVKIGQKVLRRRKAKKEAIVAEAEVIEVVDDDSDKPDDTQETEE